MTAGLVVCAVALAVATAAGLTWRATSGRMRRPVPKRAGAGSPGAAPVPRVSASQLGRPLGERATLLQFSSAFCAPCRATRVILADVAGRAEGVAHVEIDAESHLDLVRELGVLRTPTVLVLAADGRIVRRASGQPRRADVLAALGEAVSPIVSYPSGLERR